MMIKSISEAKEYLADAHPESAYTDSCERASGMHQSLIYFRFCDDVKLSLNQLQVLEKFVDRQVNKLKLV